MPYRAVAAKLRAVRIPCAIAWIAAACAGCSLPSNGLGPDLGDGSLDGGPRPPSVDATPAADGADDRVTLDAPTDDGESTDGCACSTAACCGDHCPFAHNNGMGQVFYDCAPASTYDTAEARAACTTYANSVSGDPSSCTETPCSGSVAWCYADPSGSVPCAPCWYYSGTETSFVDDCVCPGDRISMWN